MNQKKSQRPPNNGQPADLPRGEAVPPQLVINDLQQKLEVTRRTAQSIARQRDGAQNQLAEAEAMNSMQNEIIESMKIQNAKEVEKTKAMEKKVSSFRSAYIKIKADFEAFKAEVAAKEGQVVPETEGDSATEDEILTEDELGLDQTDQEDEGIDDDLDEIGLETGDGESPPLEH